MEAAILRDYSEKNKAITLLLIILLTALFNLTYAQPKAKTKEGAKQWTATVNTGIVSYYGDLSNYDHNFFAKLQNESGFGYGILFQKHLDRAFSIGGQLIAGNFAMSHQNIQLETNLLEYNMQARLNLVEMFLLEEKKHKLGITGFAGIGNFIFNSKQTIFYEGGYDEKTHKARVPEFIYFFGGGAHYNIYSGMDVSVELSIRQFQNDKIDLVVIGNNYDYYSYLQLGLSINIDDLFKANSKKKANIANRLSNQRPVYR